MKSKAFLLLAVLAVFLAAMVTAAVADPPEKVRVLIGFKDKPGAEHEALVRGLGGEIKHRYDIVRAMAASLPEEALTALAAHPNVRYIEDDGLVGVTAETIPWGEDRIQADSVWPLGNTGSTVKVFFIDTGIAYTHPDLAANYQGGYNFVSSSTDPMDDNGHGTHVAGIVAAALNGAGVVGAAPSAGLYAVKVLNSSGSGYVSDLVAGIQYAVNNGAQVINMSLGTNFDFQTLHDACDSAYFTSGIVVVAAAGNDANPPNNTVDYPAAYSSVIAVGATDSSNSRASWSSTGPSLELMAPGVSILSTYLNGSYVYLSGTSMASPHVAGTAALIIASGVTGAAAVRQKLIDTALDLGAAGWDPLYGWGLINAYKAATNATAPAPTVNQAPVANAGPNQTVVATNSDGTATVTLNGSASYDPDGSIVAYQWQEGTKILSTLVSFTANFAVGTHTITLTVTDNAGATGSATVVVTVTAPATTTPPPVTQTLSVSVSTDRSSYNPNQPVTITATVSLSGSPVSGASVTFTITRDSKVVVTASGTTGSTGTASYIWTAKSKPSGTYQVTASAALATSGLSGSTATPVSFKVQ